MLRGRLGLSLLGDWLGREGVLGRIGFDDSADGAHDGSGSMGMS